MSNTNSGTRSNETQPLTSHNKLRIVFMGTPEFAVASLAALLAEGYEVAAVITAPDKPSGRGLHLAQSAVKKYALEKGLKILQPQKLKDGAFLHELKMLGANLQVVVAFRMLPEVVWSMPPMGTINVHASLLPQYRGAAPINWAIINGEKETGITTFKLKQEIDTGDILLQARIPIGDDETAGELHDRMKETGAQLLVETLNGLSSGSLKEKPQEPFISGQSFTAGDTDPGNHIQPVLNTAQLHHAPKLFTETCKIDWTKSVSEVYNLIRGLSPYPGAFTLFAGRVAKIYSAEKEFATSWANPGDFMTDSKTYLKFAAAGGFICVRELQVEGKKKMNIADFLRGYRG